MARIKKRHTPLMTLTRGLKIESTLGIHWAAMFVAGECKSTHEQVHELIPPLDTSLDSLEIGQCTTQTADGRLEVKCGDEMSG